MEKLLKEALKEVTEELEVNEGIYDQLAAWIKEVSEGNENFDDDKKYRRLDRLIENL